MLGNNKCLDKMQTSSCRFIPQYLPWMVILAGTSTRTVRQRERTNEVWRSISIKLCTRRSISITSLDYVMPFCLYNASMYAVKCFNNTISYANFGQFQLYWQSVSGLFRNEVNSLRVWWTFWWCATVLDQVRVCAQKTSQQSVHSFETRRARTWSKMWQIAEDDAVDGAKIRSLAA